MKRERNSHQSSNPTFNRLHQIISRREAREGLLYSSIIHNTSILQNVIVNAPHLYNYPQLINNNQQNLVHLSLPINAFLPSSPSQPNNNIVFHPQPSSFTSPLNSSYNLTDSVIFSPPPSTATLRPSQETHNVFSTPPASSLETTIGRIIRDYRISNSNEPLPPRFNPTNPLPSGDHSRDHSSQLIQSQDTSFAPYYQPWSTHD